MVTVLTINESKTMKKIYSFMVAAVALFSAASCNKELPQENLPAVGEAVVYTASTDRTDTKAALNETTKKSEWVAGDEITVHDGTKGWTFTTAEAGANVEFSNTEGFGEYRPVLAIYPAGEYNTVNVAENTVKAYIPTWQQAQAGTYHSSAALAVAYSEDKTFAFKNAHALLKFTVNADNVTHVIFHGNGSEAITGDVNVTLGEEGVESVECLETEFTEQQWNEGTQQNEDVKVTKYGTWVECYAYHDEENKYFAKGQTYYIAVAPQTFEGGVTVKVKINGGEELVAKTTANRVETKINTILDLGDIKYETPVVHDWAVAGTFNEWNATANPMTQEGDYYVAKNITGLNYTAPTGEETGSSTGIKFINNGDTWRGGEGQVTAGVWAYVWGDGDSNIYVAGATAETAYDIYLNPSEGDYGKFVIVAAGEEMPEDKPATAQEWYLVGDFNSWAAADPDYKLTLDGEWYVFKNFVADGKGVKFVADAAWKINRGGSFIANQAIKVSQDGSNLTVTAGTYDVYLNTDATEAYFMNPGLLPGEAPEPEGIYAEEGWVYLKPNSNWTKDNARFAIYFFGSGETWVSMTKVEGTNYYGVKISDIISNGYTNLIFCRMNGGTSTNSWDNKWNQTGDLNVSDFTSGKNCFAVPAGSWDGATTGWSTVTKLN